MSKMRDNPDQLSLRFEQSSFPAETVETGLNPSNVVRLNFAKRQNSIQASATSLDERAILEEVLSEARKLKW